MTSPSARGWGMGWPANRAGDMVRVESAGAVVMVHKAIAPLVQHAMDAAPAYGYALHPGWCWGYANRAIRGTNVPSDHSWGLAVDLNAPTNPMGPTLVTDLPAGYVELWRSLGFRWGGDYAGRKDAMHFEYEGTVADAARSVANIVGTAVAAPPPLPDLGGRILRRGSKGPDVANLQTMLERVTGKPSRVDGDFGPATEAAVTAFQRWTGKLAVDGKAGPRTKAVLSFLFALKA
jgi:hypothetical protein